MILINRHLALIFTLLILVTTVTAQDLGNSPYSRYGIGDIIQNGNARNIGIGGAGVGSPDFRFINYLNPAILAMNSVVSFEGGLLYQQKRVRSNDESQIASGSLPAYGVLAFPISKKWTSSIGIRPNSVISFERTYTEQVEGDSISELLVNELGEGGTNTVFFGNGVKLGKDFFVGLELSYGFGRRQIESTFGINQIDPIEQPVLKRRENFRGFGYKIGGFYRVKLDSGGRTALGIGGTFAGPQSFHSDIFVSGQTKIFDLSISEDTFSVTDGSVEIPMNARIGIGIKRGTSWTLSFDLSYTPWSNFESSYNRSTVKDILSYHAGFEWIPNYRSVKNVFSRSIYRIGFRYEPYAFEVNQGTFNEIGMNLGFSMPINKINYLSLGFEFGRRGTLENNLILENFARISFGMTINDPSWFRRYKHD